MASNTGEILSLKVMSLSHSSIDSQVSTLKLLPTDLDNSEEELLCIDNMFPLLLPTSQCRLYCGESFHAFLSISNSSIIKAKAVVLKVELVGTNKRHILYNNEESYMDIDIGDSMDIVIRERVDEIGLYSLICQLFFTSNEVRVTQKKSYKFAVLSPFNILHRVFYLEDSDIKIGYLEVSLENISHQSIAIHEISLIPINQKDLMNFKFKLEDIDSFNQNDDRILVHTRCKYNKIFKIITEVVDSNSNKMNVDALQINLKIKWRSKTYGEAWIDNYRINYKLFTSTRDFREGKLNIKLELPSVVKKYEEFSIKLHIINNSSLNKENLMIKLNSNELLPILILGNDKLNIENLNANGTISFDLSCIVLLSGVQNFEGIYIFDDQDQEVG